MLIMLILAFICMVIAFIQIINENKKAKTRKTLNKSKKYSCIPWDADERLRAFLNTNKTKDKEYKLAALIVEDEYGHKYVEDIDLRGDNSTPIKLSSFAFNKTKDKADAFLFDTGIINTIASKVNCIIENNIERYYAFQMTKENIQSGRHNKQKRQLKNDYVMLLDLSFYELRQIANLSF